ncbi:PQ loop repeat-domain-containing protein [Flammula alnicola]|nr:PQ loop repeat-domain-containing protein [Flammula alnicola]
MLAGDNLSSVLGWISIACWIVVYSPQIYENYTLQSGEGLSVLFVIIWLLGDLTNLAGALLAGLLPTVILLALYYTTCDFILLCQIYYYRCKKNRLAAHAAAAGELEERAPLLENEGSHAEEIVPARTLVIRYVSALAFVVAVGVAAWWITKEHEQERDLVNPAESGKLWWTIQLLGWSSATLFLGARIPQILKNFKTRCEGLSPALFFFAIFGNTTYALSICAKSMDKAYLIKNGGWLAGSLLTVFLDIFVSTFPSFRHSF